MGGFFISAPFTRKNRSQKRRANGALEDSVTKEEIMTAIVETAKRLGESPSRAELLKAAGVNRRALRKHFGTYGKALDACGLERNGGGRKVPMERLFQDWTKVAREVQQVPRLTDYEQLSQYSVRPLMTRFGLWGNVPLGMKLFAEEQGLTDGWKDVLEMVERHGREQSDVPQTGCATCQANNPDGPANVRTTDPGQPAGVCTDERGRGGLPFWGHV
jgi:hypothetical protein